MKPGLPLSVRILLWALLNLLLLASLGWFLVRGQFSLGLDSLLAGRAGERLQIMADSLGGELAHTPESDWDSILARTAATYGLELIVTRADGRHWSGPPLDIPPEISQRLSLRGGPGEPRQGPPNPRNPDIPRPPDSNERLDRQDGNFRDSRPTWTGPGGRDRSVLTPDDASPDPRRQRNVPRPRFLLRAGHPPRYWAGMILPGLSIDGRPAPAMLLAVADSLTTGAWLIDPLPWLLGGFGAVLLSILLWYPLVRGVTRSIREVTGITERMALGKFDTSVTITRNDELGRLGTAVNHLSGRLDHFVNGQRRFLGDIAHELCSPLARMQLGASLIERDSPPAQRERLQDVQEEIILMTSLVNELLTFAKIGLQSGKPALTPVNLHQLATQTLARETTPADPVHLHIPPDLSALANPELLDRALGNLIRNALRYAAHAGPVNIAAARDNTHILLTVTDHGPGIPEPDLERIFEPFYRPDTARTREAGGTGLGLAIVRTCIESCQGTVTAKNQSPHGLQIQIRLQPA